MISKSVEKGLSPFERVPSEIRVMIYNLLLCDNGIKTLQIRNRNPNEYQERGPVCRSTYNIVEHDLYRRSRVTTYYTTSDIDMHTAIMRVNRKICEETSYFLYNTRSFSFGRDLEAVVPFFGDLRPETRPLVTEICLSKQGFVFSRDYDKCEWSEVCKFLANNMQIRNQKLVVEGGKPRSGWHIAQTFSSEDFKVLRRARHEPLEWVWELLAINGIQDVGVESDMRDTPLNHSQAMTFFEEFSASIETGFTEFLRAELIKT